MIYISHSDMLERSIKDSQELFEQQVRLVHELLGIDYLESVSRSASKSISDRNELDYFADVISQVRSADRSGDALATIRRGLLGKGIYMAVFSHGNPVLGDSFVKEMAEMDPKDSRGIHFRYFLDASDQARAVKRYGTFRIEDSTSHPVLAGFWLLPGREVLVMARSAKADEEEYLRIDRDIIEHIQDSLADLKLSAHSTLAVFSQTGRVLASRGPAIPVNFFHSGAFERAREDGQAEGRTEGDEPSLYNVRFFPPFGWYVASYVPLSTFTRPAIAHSLKLAGVVLAVFLLCGLFAIFLVNRLTRPLGMISERARDLSRVDFSRETNFAEKLNQGFSVRGDDEIGQLASAFSHMITSLDQNITQLKQTLVTQQRMEGELNAGHDIQRSILTPCEEPFTSPGFEAYAFVEPAKEVGGDLYEVVRTPGGRWGLVVGDVSGKGVSAALFMTMTLTLVRYALAEGLSPAEVMTRVNAQIARNNPTCMFVTLWIGIFDPVTGILRYANGGHCMPEIVNAHTGQVRRIEGLSGPMVGPIEDVLYKNYRMTLAEGDLCLVYSDGVSEAMNERNELFGEEQVKAVLAQQPARTCRETIEAMMDAVRAHRGDTPPSDDITMLTFSRVPKRSAA